ncbi:MAG: flagellar biosynthesis protein FlhF [Psychrobacter glaciei]|jgi:flagellar biosynthesis protein FlhF
MKVRRFTATSMQKALKTVRDEMGPDAVILSNHRVKGGVEIIVAQNYEPFSAKKSAPIFNAEEEDSHLPSPKFSSESKSSQSKLAKQLKQKSAKNKKYQTESNAQQKDHNPWPFLSDADRVDVEAQLKLQDQLEALKKQREGNGLAADLAQAVSGQTSPLGHPAHHAALHQPVQSDLQTALDEMKNNRSKSNSDNITPINNSSSYFQNSYSQNSGQQAGEQPNKQLIDDVRNELNDLKEMLMATANAYATPASKQTAENITQNIHTPANFIWKKYSPANTLQARLWRRFENMGFDEWLNYQLVNHLDNNQDEKSSWQACLQDLTQHISISPSDRLKRGGIFALVGPTGAGKTTTIAKMAVRFTLEHENAKVGLITMDNYRLAAHDQLRTLGQIMGVPVQVADQEHSVAQCIKDLKGCDLILIDTAGLTPEHPMLKYQLDQLVQLKDTVQTLLTLPATCNSRVLRKVFNSYKSASLAGCVVTKIDEASSLGDVISVLLETGLNLSYSTDGQRIPDDIQVASAKGLVKQAVIIAQQEQQLAREAGIAQGAW